MSDLVFRRDNTPWPFLADMRGGYLVAQYGCRIGYVRRAPTARGTWEAFDTNGRQLRSGFRKRAIAAQWLALWTIGRRGASGRLMYDGPA